MGKIYKYLEELVDPKDLPQNWNPDDKRQKAWKRQREECGFDERETWSLDYTFRLWFYQRLKMYNEINCIDSNHHKFKFKEEEYTLQECIDYILEAFELSFKNDDWNYKKEMSEKVYNAYKIIGIIMPYLWW